jgi:hypothetical protein
MLQPFAHLSAGCYSGPLEDRLTTLKNDEIRNGLNAESRRQIRVSFRAYLEDQSTAAHLASRKLSVRLTSSSIRCCPG